ncbi:heterogeneous nuclear ribonucleoprotein F-like, partial [Hibiscus syriacus]|uniref:heterogeneous nuclear ribonucleoprotein F-like n=1 Tax=Hibiscus syriacus TaxID=106335 RepID=UPI001920661E
KSEFVFVIFDKNGKFSGEAFCVLGYPLQVDFALQKNIQNMGRRYVEVFRSKRHEYYNAIANEVADARGGSPCRNGSRAKSSDEAKETVEHTGILRLRGLPFSAGKDDIIDFFKDFVLSEDAIHIVLNSERRPNGEAFVEFANAEDSKAAIAKDRMTLGSRYIELFPSFPKEMVDAMFLYVSWSMMDDNWVILRVISRVASITAIAAAGRLPPSILNKFVR